ncbi:MAG: glycosyltransferase family 4 protein, partial [Gammaproteobacteria bacterium]
MRIVLLTQNFAPDVGGIEVLMTGLAGALAGRGHSVLVLADAPRPGAPPEAGPPPPYAIRRFGGLRPWRRRRKAGHAARLLREKTVDAVIADSWKSLELLPPPAGMPVLCLAHGMEFPLRPGPGKRRRIIRSLRGVQVIANSRYTAERAAPFLDSTGDVTVIPPGIDAPPSPEPAERERARQVLAGQAPRLISVARLEPHKGIDRVLECLPSLLEDFPRLVYVI